MIRRPPRSTLFSYPTLFRSIERLAQLQGPLRIGRSAIPCVPDAHPDFVGLPGLDGFGHVNLKRRKRILFKAAIAAVHVNRRVEIVVREIRSEERRVG